MHGMGGGGGWGREGKLRRLGRRRNHLLQLRFLGSIAMIRSRDCGGPFLFTNGAKSILRDPFIGIQLIYRSLLQSRIERRRLCSGGDGEPAAATAVRPVREVVRSRIV